MKENNDTRCRNVILSSLLLIGIIVLFFVTRQKLSLRLFVILLFLLSQVDIVLSLHAPATRRKLYLLLNTE